MAASPAAAWCCRSMPASAPFPSISCRWNSALRDDERSARYRHRGAVVWLTGLPASGKSTLARALERRLFGQGGSPVLLDGDTLRAGLNSDLGFSARGPHRKHPPARRSRHPSGAQRPHRHRRRGFALGGRSRRGAPHRRHGVPRNLCRDPGGGVREPRPQGPLRQGARRFAAWRSPASATTTSRRPPAN